MERFLKAAEPVRDNPWFNVAGDLHAAVMREWAGTRQLERTLHTECRRRMQSAGVPPKMIELLVPKKPPN
jgi:hypothetical protein